MRPTIPLIIAAALVFILGQGMDSQAKVVHTGKAAPANPAVEVGGYRVRPGVVPPIQYSMILAPAGQWVTPGFTPWSATQGSWLASQSRWFRQCRTWPWGFFGSPAFRPPGSFGSAFRPPGSFGRVPVGPRINWLLPSLR